MPGSGQQRDVNRAGHAPPLRSIALSARRWAKAPARQGPGLKPTLIPYVFVPARLAGRTRPAILKSIEPVGAGHARPMPTMRCEQGGGYPAPTIRCVVGTPMG